MKFYKGPWVQDNLIGESSWRIPCDNYSAIDLRANPEFSGMALFCTDLMFNEAGYETLTEKQALGLAKSYLIHNSDVDGILNPKPIMPDKKMDLNIILGPLLYKEKLIKNSEHYSKVVRVLKNNVLKMPTVLSGKYASMMVRKFGHDPLPNIKKIEPSTTITESFPGTSANLGGDMTWTELIGTWSNSSGEGTLLSAGGNRDARAESDLSSSDHYSQVLITTFTKGSSDIGIGPMVRFDSASNTGYGGIIYQSGATKYAGFCKVSSGTFTFPLLDSGATWTGASQTLKMDISGSSLEFFIDDVSTKTLTDTSITSGVRTGLYGYVNGTSVLKFDDFLASDGLSGSSKFMLLGVG